MSNYPFKAGAEGVQKPVVTAVTEQFGEGQFITKAVIEFADEVPDINAIAVTGRTITGRRAEGKTVTLELSPEDKAAPVIPAMEHRPGGPGGPGGPRKGPGGPRPDMPGKERRKIVLELSIPGYSGPIASTKTVQTDIGGFVQKEYRGIPYNLFVPADYDPAKKYPLVMFIPDAGANGSDPLLALSQGIGGTCWASEREQEKHPCLVLAIQVPRAIHLTYDDYHCAPELENIKEILDLVMENYSIDTDRVYTTGQSQGCMASCELNLRYPELFAASMLISGHWDLGKMSRLKDHRFLFGLSEGGLKEYPNFNAMTDDYMAQGVDVGKVRLNFRDGWSVNEAKTRRAIEGKQMAYIIFDKETAFPDDGKARPDMMHHARGWELTYQLEAARDWLFAQHK